MPNDTELVSLPELKSYLQLSTNGYDSVLSFLKSSVETWIKNYCRDPFLVADYTEYYDGNGSNSIHVRHYPIVSITSVHIDSNRVFGSDTLVAAADIIDTDQSKAQGLIELFGETFSTGQKNVKIVYRAGYSTVPADLKLAIKTICAREFLIQDKKMAGIVSQSVSDKTLSLNLEEIPRNAWTILQAYRRPLV